jgi:tetratricopeptide (TPR) repeat protein
VQLTRRALPAAALLGVLAASALAAPRRPAAPGHDPRQEKLARTHFDRAEKAFNLGRFQEALVEYQAAYEALPLPAFVFNIAQCHRNLGDEEKAIFFYQRFLSLQPDAPNRGVVEELIAEQGRKLEQRRTAEAPPTPEPPADAGAPPAPPTTTAEPPPPAPQRLAPEPVLVHAPPPSRRPWWVLGALSAALLGGAVLLVLRGSGSLPTGSLDPIDTRGR